MIKTIIHTEEAPAAIGPYSQGVAAGGFLFLSGQLGIIPATGELAVGIEAQTRQALANIAAVLASQGQGMEAIVKTTIFLVDLADFATVNAVYRGCFDGDFPARTTVQVAGLPKGGLVEIEVVAVLA